MPLSCSLSKVCLWLAVTRTSGYMMKFLLFKVHQMNGSALSCSAKSNWNSLLQDMVGNRAMTFFKRGWLNNGLMHPLTQGDFKLL